MIRDPSDGSVKKPAPEQLIKRDYGPNWGLKSLDRESRKPKPAPTADELREHYAKHGLGFKPKIAELDQNQD